MKLRLAFLLFSTGIFLALPAKADLASTIAKVKPSVVIVGTFKSTNSPRFGLRGTGFVVGDAKAGASNLVITNAHVLQHPGEQDMEAAVAVQLRVGQNEWQMRNAAVVEVDRIHDLALLRFEGPAAPALSVRDSGSVLEGQSVAFMGFPIGGALGFSPVTHRGTISAITVAALPTASSQQLNGQAIRSLRGDGAFDVFQLDATAYPGNSGGPMFDPDTGDVLGVLNMVFIKGSRESALTNPSGISYAIPSGYMLQLMQRAKAK